MRMLPRKRAVDAWLLAGWAAVVLPLPAQAQQARGPDEQAGASILDQNAQQAGPASTTGESIVVTGSRIARPDYEANSPIVTVDSGLLSQSSTAALEANLNKLPQFTPAQTPTAGGDIQPTATNTPGAATISLRGIGANRNLVLLDGRRATPSNASGVVDISTIPAAAVERVEVISGGASATYGADAVAGVTNFILKQNFQGLELDGRIGITQEGDGFEYDISGIMGTDFSDGRGNISLAMSLNTREANFQRDRPWYRDLWTDPNAPGTSLRLDHPGIAFTAANPFSQAAANQVFPGATPAIPPNSTIYVNPNGNAFTGNNFTSRGGSRFFQQPLDGFPYKGTAAGTIAKNETDFYLILPLTRYNAFARGNYEINDTIGLFAQGLFSSVSTKTVNAPGPITGGWAVDVPYGNQIYTGNAAGGIPSSVNADGTTNAAYLAGGAFGLDCPATGGCVTSQVFPVPDELRTLLLSRRDPNAPFTLNSLLPDPRQTFTDVTTYSLIAGLEGSVPGTDWTWESFVSHGVSETFARQTGVYSLERLRAVVTSPNYGYGFRQQGNAASGGFGASSGTCSSGLNFFTPPTGGFAEDCLEATRADLKNRSSFRQTVVEANVQGGLFSLPAGDVRFAAGAGYREMDYEFINDTLTTQGRSFRDQALGIYPSGNAFGYIDVKEVYGEALIPLLADLPLVDELTLELGGRVSDYSTTGTSYTYKALGDWRVTDWLRFRGGYNRAERAPNIGELFLAAQQTFGANNRGDVCSRANPNAFSANPATNPNAAQVEAVCRVLMAQTGQPEAVLDFYGTPENPVPQSPSASGTAFPTLVGNRDLRPEKADTWTAGVVVQSPLASGPLSRLRLSVDWFDIRINNAIGAQTIGAVLQQCFDPAFNPLVLTNATAAANSQFCQLVPRNQTGQLGNVSVTYANSGRVHLQGIDGQLDWAVPIGPGTLNANVLVNYLIDFKSSPLASLPMVDYAGTFGTTENGLNQGAYEYRIFATLGYGIGGARLALQWQHLPAVEDPAEPVTPNNTSGAPAYSLFNLNGSVELGERTSLRFGVDNLFNKAPPRVGIDLDANPAIGQLGGGSFNSTFYDTNGRRFYLGANIRF